MLRIELSFDEITTCSALVFTKRLWTLANDGHWLILRARPYMRGIAETTSAARLTMRCAGPLRHFLSDRTIRAAPWFATPMVRAAPMLQAKTCAHALSRC